MIEKVIDRCIQKDPAQRPASALQVAAALPGGDPIAAALAAGETPSPEMVAAAPKQGILRSADAGALLASFLVLLALSLWLTKYSAVYRMTPLDEPPEALRAHARDVIRELGYTEQPLDSADGVILKEDYLHLPLGSASAARADAGEWRPPRHGLHTHCGFSHCSGWERGAGA